MRLKITCSALLVSVAVCLCTATAALAATSPTASIKAATAVGASSATLNASINPNGAATTYYFSYGPTAGLGVGTPQHTLASGTKAKSVSAKVSGLLSGTTYYFDLTAVNTAGTSVTKQLTFKTTGPPPPSAVTGQPVVGSSTSVTLTATINTQDAATGYYFEYGTTSSYGTQTPTEIETPSTSPSQVSYTVTGLTPGTVFFYAIVADNGGSNATTGSSVAFETWPSSPFSAGLKVKTTPKTAVHGPYVLTSVGQVTYTNKTTPTLACTGTAEATYYYGARKIYSQAVPVDPYNCLFKITTEFKTLPVAGHTKEPIKVYVRFNGNHYFKAKIAAPSTVTLG